MTLSLYFFRQFLPSFVFGAVLFVVVLMLEKLFDIVDLIFNKGVAIGVVAQLFALFVPTILPLTLPMAVLLACLVTFGRLSEENEISAVRAAGISLFRVLWLPPLFAVLLSAALLPFNTRVAPASNNAFRSIYEEIIAADPLLTIEPRRFFALKDIRLYAHGVDKRDNRLSDVFVYQLNDQDAQPADRIFARSGTVRMEGNEFRLELTHGQMQRFDAADPRDLVHTAFGTYRIAVPLERDATPPALRFRSVPSVELTNMIDDLKQKGLPTGPLEAELSMRHAIAFAPIALLLVGIPLATVLRRGGRSFSFGVTLVVLFAYYTLLILGLTLAERGVVAAPLGLWMGNAACLVAATVLLFRLGRQ